MFKNLTLCAALLFSLNVIGADEQPTAQPEQVQPEIQLPEMPDFKAFLPEKLAKIKDTIITRDEIIENITTAAERDYRFRFGIAVRLTTKELVKEQILKPVIAQKILETLSESAGYKPSFDDAVKACKKQLSEMPAEQQAQFAQYVAQENMTPDSYILRIAQQPEFQRQVSISAYVDDKICNNLPKPDSAMIASMSNIRCSHILIKVDQGASAQDKALAKSKIESLAKQIKEGGDFAKLAEENSDCPSKANGGDLGPFGKGMMVPAFETAAFALKDGEVSGVVETQFGYHLIKRVPYQDNSEELTERVKNIQREEALQKAIEKAEKEMGVEYYI